MKLICSVVVLMVVCCGVELSCGEELQCDFVVKSYDLVGNWYSCFVTSLNNINNNLSISGYSGVHYSDVKGIWIHDTHVTYIPANLGSLFQLTAFASQSTHLIEIKAMDFSGMSYLQCLNLGDNLLKSVPLDAFSKLTQLRILNLNYNNIEELKNGLFDFNLNLEKVDLQKNVIKFIGSGIFSGLKKLNIILFKNNNCLIKNYEEASKITQLKQDIIENCIKSMEVQLIEMLEKIQNLVNKLHDKTQELHAKTLNFKELNDELMEVKEHHRMEQIAFREVKEKLDKAIQELKRYEDYSTNLLK